MEALTNTFDTKINFWKANPGLMTIDPFREFVKNEGTTYSSKVMWLVCFVCDPKSPYRNIPEELRIRTLLDNEFLEEKDYKRHKDVIKTLMSKYYLLTETPAMRQLRIWNLKMDEKSAFMEVTAYDANTFEMLEKMMSSNAKIYSELELITKKLATEDDTITRGGAQESLTDKGEI